MTSLPTTTDYSPLTPAEADQLAHDEAIIEAGIAGFLKVGMALCRIRDQRTYRATHATFEDYVDDRWHMSKTRAYQLIEAGYVADAVASVRPQIVDVPEVENEGQARALAPVVRDHGPEVAAEVLADAAESGKVTAVAITKAAEKRKVARPKAKKKPIKVAAPKAPELPGMSTRAIGTAHNLIAHCSLRPRLRLVLLPEWATVAHSEHSPTPTATGPRTAHVGRPRRRGCGMSATEPSGLDKRDTDALLDIVAAGSRLSLIPEDPPTCTNCGDLLSDPDPDRDIAVIHDGWTYAVHVDCLKDTDLMTIDLDDTTACPACDRIIHHYGRARHRTYCSATCKRRARWQREHLDERELRECAGCGEVFEQRRTDQEVCSARCRQRIHRQRSRLHHPNSWTAAVTS